jgi:cell division protease FtsH
MIFLGREITEQRNYSEEVAEEIDSEVRRLVGEAYGRAKKVLTDYRGKLDQIARRLIEIETLDRAQFEALVA